MSAPVKEVRVFPELPMFIASMEAGIIPETATLTRLTKKTWLITGKAFNHKTVTRLLRAK